jgi:hypothetical protein
MRITVILCLALTLAGCSHQEPVIGVGGQLPKFGDYSRSEVEALRVAIAKLTFPVAEHTLVKMLPKQIEPLPVSFVDWVPDREKKGRVGGMMVEYWLNRGQVLRVATAYYAKDDTHYSMEEWAVILTAAERDDYDRRIY